MEQGEGRCIISRDVTFDESKMAFASSEEVHRNKKECTHFEVELPTKTSQVEEGTTNEELDGTRSTDQSQRQGDSILEDYQLTRDRVRR